MSACNGSLDIILNFLQNVNKTSEIFYDIQEGLTILGSVSNQEAVEIISLEHLVPTSIEYFRTDRIYKDPVILASTNATEYDLNLDNFKSIVLPSTDQNLGYIKSLKPKANSRIYFFEQISNDSLEITEFYSVCDPPIEVSNHVESWQNGALLKQSTSLLHRRSDLKGCTFKVGVVEYKPYLFITGTNISTIRGFDIELLKYLKEAMNFDFVYVFPDDGEFGSKSANGSWSGLVKLLVDKEIHFTASSLANTFERSQVIDFSVSFSTYYADLISQTRNSIRVNSFLAVFNKSTWISLVFTLMALVFGIGFIALAHNTGSITLSFFAIIGGFLCQGTPQICSALSVRVIMVTCLLFGMVSFAVFGALLTSVLSVNLEEKLVDSLEEIYNLELDIYFLRYIDSQ